MENFQYKHKGWVGFDLDGTLATYTGWVGFSRIGQPVPEIVSLMVAYASQGYEVRVFTGRVAPDPDSNDIPVEDRRDLIRQWLSTCVVPYLPEGYPEIKITHEKDKYLYMAYDDRVQGVVPSKGLLYTDLLHSLYSMVAKLVLSAKVDGSFVHYITTKDEHESLQKSLDKINYILKSLYQDLPESK